MKSFKDLLLFRWQMAKHRENFKNTQKLLKSFKRKIKTNIKMSKIVQKIIKTKKKPWVNEMATDGTWIFLIISHFSPFFLSCGFAIIIILSVFGPCPQCQDGMSKQKQTTKQNSQMLLMMEDKSMVCGWVYSAHKSTEKQWNNKQKQVNEWTHQLKYIFFLIKKKIN